MTYFARVRDGAVRGLGGPPSFIPVYLHTSSPSAIGEAYYSGDDASGEPVWSLKIAGRWVEGRWKLLRKRFTPAQEGGRQPRE
jgi:hypothetical protein